MSINIEALQKLKKNNDKIIRINQLRNFNFAPIEETKQYILQLTQTVG